MLARTYHESDLLVAEALTSGLLDGLDPAALAGLLSCFTYEHRGPGEPEPPWFPSRQVRARWSELERLAAELQADEEAAGLPPTRAPDPGFAALAHAWAAGEPLGDVLGDEDLSGGDFVRNVKTLIDLVRQVGVRGARSRDRPGRPPGGGGAAPRRRVDLVDPRRGGGRGRRARGHGR